MNEFSNSSSALGVVSNLFNRDEQGEIISELIPIMKREFPKRELNQENVMEYFMSRVRQHLHIALCFSPVTFPLLILFVATVIHEFFFCC